MVTPQWRVRYAQAGSPQAEGGISTGSEHSILMDLWYMPAKFVFKVLVKQQNQLYMEIAWFSDWGRAKSHTMPSQVSREPVE